MDAPGGIPAPAGMVERARRFAAGGGRPAPPRVAASVILLRPAAGGGFQVYALRRARTMVFGGVYAFPGGAVEPADTDVPVAPSAALWAARLRLPTGAAQGVGCAAARELFEETGVLLAGPPAGPVVADAARFERARGDIAGRRLGMTGFLERTGLAVRADLLAPWSRWITPEFEPRRFDAYFFLAALPPGQAPRDVSGEADHAQWITPAEALARHAAGGLPLLPPTLVTLRELTAYADIGAALAAATARAPGVPVRPRLSRAPDGAHTVDL